MAWWASKALREARWPARITKSQDRAGYTGGEFALVTAIQCHGLNQLSRTRILDSMHDLYKNLCTSILPSLCAGTVSMSWVEMPESVTRNMWFLKDLMFRSYRWWNTHGCLWWKEYLSLLLQGALHRTEAIIVNTVDFPAHLTFCQGVKEWGMSIGSVGGGGVTKVRHKIPSHRWTQILMTSDLEQWETLLIIIL